MPRYDPLALSAASSQGPYAQEELQRKNQAFDPSLLFGLGAAFTPPQFPSATAQPAGFQLPDLSMGGTGVGGGGGGGGVSGGGQGGGVGGFLQGLQSAGQLASTGKTLASGLGKLGELIFGGSGIASWPTFSELGLESPALGPLSESDMVLDAAGNLAPLASSGVASWPTFSSLGLESPALGPLSEVDTILPAAGATVAPAAGTAAWPTFAELGLEAPALGPLSEGLATTAASTATPAIAGTATASGTAGAGVAAGSGLVGAEGATTGASLGAGGAPAAGLSAAAPFVAGATVPIALALSHLFGGAGAQSAKLGAGVDLNAQLLQQQFTQNPGSFDALINHLRTNGFTNEPLSVIPGLSATQLPPGMSGFEGWKPASDVVTAALTLKQAGLLPPDLIQAADYAAIARNTQSMYPAVEPWMEAQMPGITRQQAWDIFGGTR